MSQRVINILLIFYLDDLEEWLDLLLEDEEDEEDEELEELEELDEEELLLFDLDLDFLGLFDLDLKGEGVSIKISVGITRHANSYSFSCKLQITHCARPILNFEDILFSRVSDVPSHFHLTRFKHSNLILESLGSRGSYHRFAKPHIF